MSSGKYFWARRISAKPRLSDCRFFQFFRSGQENDIRIHCQSIEQLLTHLPASSLYKIGLMQECRELLDEAEKLVKKWPTFYFSEPWAALHEIRHRLCWLSPRYELVRVVVDISNDLPYITDTREMALHKTAIDEWITALSSLAGNSQDPKRKSHREIVEELVETRISVASESQDADGIRHDETVNQLVQAHVSHPANTTGDEITASHEDAIRSWVEDGSPAADGEREADSNKYREDFSPFRYSRPTRASRPGAGQTCCVGAYD
jgi:hypothetical protein